MTNLSTRRVAAPSSTGSMTPARRLRWLGPVGIVAAVGFSVAEWMVVRGPDNDGTVPQTLLALTMTAPVVLARRWPVPAAAAVLVAALVNGLVYPDLVRCAGAIPAAIYIAFAAGAWSRENGRSWAWPIAGLLLSAGGVVAQYAWDPALHADSSFLVFGPGLVTIGWAAGVGWSLLARRWTASRVATAG